MLGSDRKEESPELSVLLSLLECVVADYEAVILFEVANGSRDALFTLRELTTSVRQARCQGKQYSVNKPAFGVDDESCTEHHQQHILATTS